MTWLHELFELHSRSQRMAAIDDGRPITGQMLMGKVAAAADFLAESIDPVDQPVPALLSTNADALALILGGAAASRPLAPLGPLLAVQELAGTVQACGSSTLITEARFADVASKVAAAAGGRVVTLPALPTSARSLAVAGGQTAFFLHTAGTTGTPKRVGFTQSVLGARADLLRELFGFSTDSRYATGSPLHHVGGLGNTLGALSAGAAILPTVRFTVDWWCSLRDSGVTHCLLVPTMIEIALSRGLLGAAGVRTLIYGGSPIAAQTLRRVLDELPDVRLFNLYGQTEGSPIATLDDEDHRWAAAGRADLLMSAGRVVPGTGARIEAPDAEDVGELVVRGEHIAAPGPDGWLHTGDLGRFDADGYLFLSGRRHDMIVRGGENIYPIEIEQALRRHPTVRDAGVVGVPDPRLGETVVAFVVPKDHHKPPTEAELTGALRKSLAPFKIPTTWHIVGDLPYNAAGKLVRSSLLAPSEQHSQLY